MSMDRIDGRTEDISKWDAKNATQDWGIQLEQHKGSMIEVSRAEGGDDELVVVVVVMVVVKVKTLARDELIIRWSKQHRHTLEMT